MIQIQNFLKKEEITRKEEQKEKDKPKKFYLSLGKTQKVELDFSNFSISLIKAMVPPEAALLLTKAIEQEKQEETKNKVPFENPANILNCKPEKVTISGAKISEGIQSIFKDIETVTEKKDEAVDKMAELRDFCKNTVYPIFIKLRKELTAHGREANIHIDLKLLLVAIEVRHGRNVEYDYVVQIKNPNTYPYVMVQASSVGDGNMIRSNNLYNAIAPRNNMRRPVSKVSKEDILEDFLNGYHTYLKVRNSKTKM